MTMTDSKNSFVSITSEQVVSSRLLSNSRVLSDRWSVSEPFPHVVIDNFFTGDVAMELASEISSIDDANYRVSFRSLTQRKLQLGNIKGLLPQIYPLYNALMGPSFTHLIELVAAYPNLEGDRQFTGAGMQRYHSGGFSEIHLDSNRHPFDSDLHHRVNLIIFMTPGWQPEWGGQLTLWSSGNGRPEQPVATIDPTFNRAVLFAVTGKSWHSVNRIRCPRHLARNSIAIYYFNRVAAAGDEKPRSVIWHSTHGWPRQAVFEATNWVMTLAKPHARYLRWLRPNKFDGVRTS
jgi:Rps23 Pro-64 3,4-dihydroxylase Tpa1-like proline 4-hydroxylase